MYIPVLSPDFVSLACLYEYYETDNNVYHIICKNEDVCI
jgi:hypothetical protein